MEQHERLELYEKALKDWSKPYGYGSNTGVGFCCYFNRQHFLNAYHNFEEIFPELYKQRRTPRACLDHYTEFGSRDEGRKQRVEALKAAIELCRNPRVEKNSTSMFMRLWSLLFPRRNKH